MLYLIYVMIYLQMHALSIKSAWNMHGHDLYHCQDQDRLCVNYVTLYELN